MAGISKCVLLCRGYRFSAEPVPVCLFASIKTKKKRKKNNLLGIMWIFHFLEEGCG